MEVSKIQNKAAEKMMNEIEKAKENNYNENEFTTNKFLENYITKENDAKHKLKSKFSFNEKPKENFEDGKTTKLIKRSYNTFNPINENIYDKIGLESSDRINSDKHKEDNIDLIFFKDIATKRNEKEDFLVTAEFFREKSKIGAGKIDYDGSKYHSEKILMPSTYKKKLLRNFVFKTYFFYS